MKKYIIANFKMNKNLDACLEYMDVFKQFKMPSNKLVIICPPDYAVDNFAKELEGKKNCFVGAQDSASEKDGAFTGELSATMIKSTGAKYVILGHSERRTKKNESNQEINKKVKLAVEAGLIPIVCIGEKLDEIKRKKSVLQKQLFESLDGVDPQKVIVAYEPVWAIGTGKTCELKDIELAHSYIKQKVQSKFGVDVTIVYGGSVKPSNASIILKNELVDGVLVGGASLDPHGFFEIIKA